MLGAAFGNRATEGVLNVALTSLISYSIKAAVGKPKSLPFYVPSSGLTLANAQLWSDDMAPLLDAVTEGAILGASVTFALTLPSGLKATPLADSDIQEGALFSMVAAGTIYKEGIWVPAYLQSLFTGTEVDTVGAGASKDFADYIKATTHSVAPSDKYGNDLTEVYSAEKKFRRK